MYPHLIPGGAQNLHVTALRTKNNAKVATGSVADIKEPNSRHSIGSLAFGIHPSQPNKYSVPPKTMADIIVP